MWVLSVSLLALWMVCSLLDYTMFGLTHLLFIGAVAIQLFHRPRASH